MGLITRRRRRVAGSFFAQGVSSLSNVAVSIAVGRALGVDDFGALAIALTTFYFTLEAVRALTGEVLVVRFSGWPKAEMGSRVQGAVSFALLVGAAVGAVMIGVGLVLGGPARTTFVIIGLATPLLCSQDVWRSASIAEGSPEKAAWADGWWLVLEVVAYVVCAAAHASSLGALTGAWAVAGAISALIAARPWGGGRWSATSAINWWRSEGSTAWRLCADYLLDASSFWAATAVAGIVGGYQAVAALGGARVMLGPVGVLFVGAMVVVVSEGVRMREEGHRWARHLPRVAAVLLVIGVLGWSLALRLGPGWFGRMILGDSFATVEKVIVPLGIYTAGRAVINMSRASLRMWGATDVSVKTMVVFAPLASVLAIVGAAVGGGVGAAWALAAGSTVGAVAWAWRSERAAAQRSAADRSPLPVEEIAIPEVRV